MADDLQEIHMPNGDVLQFPASMKDEDIKAAINKHYPSGPAYGSDEYNSQIAAKYGASPGYVQGLTSPQTSMATEGVKGFPILGGLANKAGAAASALAEPLTGSGSNAPTFGERYGQNLGLNEELQSDLRRENPKASLAANVAGGAAITAPAVAAAPALFGAVRGAPLAANMAMGAAGGGAIGATDAAIRGESPTAGAAFGAGLGAAGPVVGKALGAAASGVRDYFSPQTANPDLAGLGTRALEWAKNAAKADGLTESQIQAKFNELGPNGFLAEYGPNMRGLAGAVAAQPGEGKATIFNSFQDRAQGAGGRIEDAFNQALGGRTSVAQTAENIISQRSAQAAPLWQRAYDAGDRAIWSPELQRLSGAPEVQDAMHQAVNGWQRSQIAAGYGAAKPGATVANGMVDITGGRVPAFPNLQFWDYTKGAIDDMILRATRPDGTMTRQGRDLTIIAQKLRGELDGQVPEYQAARAAWEGPSKVYEALQSGQTALRRSIPADQLANEVRGMNQSQKDAFLVWLRGSLSTMTDASVNGDTTARNLIRSDAANQKLAALIGQDRADTLSQAMEREATFANTRNRTLENSETAARTAMGEMLKPNPDETIIARLRHAYSPHVTPGGLLPRAFENAAASRQSAQFEQARNQLAPLLTRQGQSAADLARALLEASSRAPGGQNASRLVNMLMQSAVAPQARRQLTDAVQ